MEAITAPYGFVPLSHDIVYPEWIQPIGGKAPPLQDVPFEDGLCGTLEIEIENETPLFTRGTRDASLPFQLSDGRFAIPGTALRGALRNVVEIITFGRFARVNDHRYAVRDLHNRDVYGKHMAEIVNRQPMPLVNAGWLSQDAEGNYSIQVCDFGKLEYRVLIAESQRRGIPGFNPGKKQSAVQKYNAWGEKTRDLDCKVDWRRPEQVNNRRFFSRYGVVTEGNSKRGQIVFTGQPSEWKEEQTGRRPGAGHPKHHDFVFFPAEKPHRLSVTKRIFEDFEFAHSNRGQQNNLGRSQEPNEEWAYWKSQLSAKKPVPVFFLTHPDGALRAFGLAMMFRLPYVHSIGEAIFSFEPEHRSSEQLDFAEGLFGTVKESLPEETASRPGVLALKGRVGISHAVAASSVSPLPAVRAILGAPKASYYPNYVEQDPEVPGSQPQNQRYRTWMDPDGAPRGWKRYRVLTQLPKHVEPTPEQARVATTFRPLPTGTKFRAHVDLHNVRPEEVGAFLWAIDFGADQQARHALGMARPLGYGKVRMQVGKVNLRNMQGDQADLSACRQRFVQYMQAQVPGWQQSPQLKELVALARPVSPEQARYQRLSPNEFVEAKKYFLALRSEIPHSKALPRQKGKGRGNGSPAPAGPQPWTPVSPGTRILIELTALNKKNKWKCSVVGYQNVVGTIDGDAPPDASPGQRHEVVVKVGQPAYNLQLKWP